MSKKIKLIFISIFSAASLMIYLSPLSSASGGTLYLSPSSGTIQIGNTTSISLRLSPTTATDSVQAYVNYDASKLQYNSLTLGAFPTCIQQSGGGGQVKLVCSIIGGGSVSSDSLIASISFTALVGSGSSSLSITNAQTAYSGTGYSPTTSGSTLSFSSPVSSTPISGSTGSGGSTSKNKSTTSSSKSTTSSSPTAVSSAATPTADSSISNKVKLNISVSPLFKSAKVSVKSNQAVQTYIAYGTNKNSLNLKSDLTKPELASTVSIGSLQLTPGQTYYYQAIAMSGNTLVGQSPISSFTTLGYTLKVAVLDNQYKPLKNKLIALHSTVQTIKTDSKGIATFKNVTPGAHEVSYSDNGKTYSQSLYASDNVKIVGNDQTAASQNLSAVLTNFTQPKSNSTATVMLTLIICLLAGGFYSYVKYIKNKVNVHPKIHHKPKVVQPAS